MEAKRYSIGEIPVGAVIVHNDTIIARAHNTTEQSGNRCVMQRSMPLKRLAPL